ncbi:unnamed protein product [Brassica napus]|uniref:(rape) hypothetical protein n=1 Tax=Brassica napus TaxID=3708 RepID=A0A817ARS0_BRANA|nr:unnamed protein product [Brassica napus]
MVSYVDLIWMSFAYRSTFNYLQMLSIISTNFYK